VRQRVNIEHSGAIERLLLNLRLPGAKATVATQMAKKALILIADGTEEMELSV